MTKRIFMFALVLVFSLCVAVQAENNNGYTNPNYGKITNDVEWKDIMQRVDNHIAPDTVAMNYLRTLVDRTYLIQLAKSGELVNDKSKFILENPDEFLKYMHFMLAFTLHKQQQWPTDTVLIYITGVINDTHAQAATNGVEYEMEKSMFGQVPIYKMWKLLREDEGLNGIINEQLDTLCKSLTE